MTSAETVSVPLLSKRRRRAQARQKAQHVIPAAILLFDGFQSVAGRPYGGELTIAVVEIVAGAWFLVTVARAIRHAHRPQTQHHAAHGVDWADIAAAGVIVVEIVEHYHRTGHIQRPNVLTASFLLLLGLFHGRIFGWFQRRRSLRITESALIVPRRPFGTFRAGWADIASIDVGDRYAIIRKRSGDERRIDLDDCENAPAVRQALDLARTRIVQP